MDDEVITNRTVSLIGEPVVLESQAWVRFLRVFWDISRWAVLGREHRLEDMPTEGVGPHWFEAMTSVLLTVIASAPSKVETVTGPLPHIAVDTSASIEGVARVMVAAETLLHQNRDACRAIMRHLVD